jgi:hypothetical protein
VNTGLGWIIESVTTTVKGLEALDGAVQKIGLPRNCPEALDNGIRFYLEN